MPDPRSTAQAAAQSAAASATSAATSATHAASLIQDPIDEALLGPIATAVAEAQAARDEAVDISGISTSDAVIASRITTPGTATETALSATYAGRAGALTGLSSPYMEFGNNSTKATVHLFANAGFSAPYLLGIGVDNGGPSYPSGILVANKAQSRGITINNQATVTDASAYGLFVLNSSTAARPARFEQTVAGHKPYQFVANAATAGDQLVEFTATAGQAGFIASDTGQLSWNRAMYVTSLSGTSALTTSGNVTMDSGTAGTISLLVTGRAAQTADVFVIKAVGGTPKQLRVNKAGHMIRALTTAPADADLSASEFVTWLDATPGATKIMWKAKDSGGTVRTGQVALA